MTHQESQKCYKIAVLADFTMRIVEINQFYWKNVTLIPCYNCYSYFVLFSILWRCCCSSGRGFLKYFCRFSGFFNQDIRYWPILLKFFRWRQFKQVLSLKQCIMDALKGRVQQFNFEIFEIFFFNPIYLSSSGEHISLWYRPYFGPPNKSYRCI